MWAVEWCSRTRAVLADRRSAMAFRKKGQVMGQACYRFAIGILVLVLAGCATTDSRVSDRVSDAIAEESPGYVYGHGVGDSREAAREAALREIAQSLVTQVVSDERTAIRRLDVAGQADSERSYELAARSFTRMSLEDVSVEHAESIEGEWYVRARISEERAEQLREEHRRQARSYALFEEIMGVPEAEAGRELMLALAGLQVARSDGVAEDGLLVEDRLTTFESFFQRRMESARERIRIISTREEDMIYFTFLEQGSYRPVRDLPVHAGEQAFRTDEQGRSPRFPEEELPQRLSFQVNTTDVTSDPGELELVGRDLMLGEYEIPPAGTTGDVRLWLGTGTDAAHVRVDGAYVPVPGFINVSPGEVRLELEAGPDHRDEQRDLDIPEDAGHYHVYLAPQVRHTGTLDLRTRGDAELSITGPAGRDGKVPEFSGTVEKGRYEVRVRRPGNGDYQTIRDEFFLEEDEEIEREYATPLSRRPWSRTWYAAIAMTVTTFPESGYDIPWEGGGETISSINRNNPDLNLRDGDEEDSSGLGISYLRLHSGLNLGWRTALQRMTYPVRYNAPDTGFSRSTEIEGWSLQGAAGFWWRPMGSDHRARAWVFGGRNYERTQWAERPAGLDVSGSRLNQHNFIEAGFMGRSYGVSGRVFEGGDLWQLSLTIGLSSTNSGYRRQEEVPARSGQHYE